MAQEYPYILKTESLRKFLERIPKSGVPQKLTQDELKSHGFTSSNDRPIIQILKFIKFLDSSGTPTENYKKFRSTNMAGAVMASCLREAYSELFNLYPDAYNKDEEDLGNFFRPNTTAGERVVTAMVGTFKTLCGFADFGPKPLEEPILGEAQEQGVIARGTRRDLIINVNVQLQLPATEDAAIYDKIFESLKKHILEKQ